MYVSIIVRGITKEMFCNMGPGDILEDKAINNPFQI